MINEEVSRKVITMEMKTSKLATKEIYKLLKTLSAKSNGKISEFLDDNFKSNKVAIKDLVKKGQLESITLSEISELKEIKKELNKCGVNFSVMKDENSKEYSVFFQAKDTAVMEKAFNRVINKFEKSKDNRESTVKKLNEFKDKVKEVVTKDKVKNKQKEQSL